MATRRRRPGRKRKPVTRHPGGQIVKQHTEACTPEMKARRAANVGGDADSWRDQDGGTVLGCLYKSGRLATAEETERSKDAAHSAATGRYLAGLDYASLMERVGRETAAPRGLRQGGGGGCFDLPPEDPVAFTRTMAQFRETKQALSRLDHGHRVALSLACPDANVDLDRVLEKAIRVAGLIIAALDALVAAAPRIKAAGRVERVREAA
jgi:hypothetical protein